VLTTTKNIQLTFAVLIILVGWGGWFILKDIYPEMNLSWYPYLPVIFLIMGIVLTTILNKVNKENPRKLVNVYMLLKLSKLVIAMIMILGFYFAMKESIRIILLVFAVYYGLYLALESYAFFITEKKIKQTNEKNI